MPLDRSLRSTPALWLRRLDFLPPWGAWALGLGGGALAGATLAGAAPAVVGFISFAGLLSLAARLALTGEPITAVEEAKRPLQAPLQFTEDTSLLSLISVPEGSFSMGSPPGEKGRGIDEGPVHEVEIHSFLTMRYPVTRRLYTKIMGHDPSWPEGDADDRPVTNVSWFDAVKFCNRLSKNEGLAACYRIFGKQVLWNQKADGYRLPTEAEWEYACRAGTTTPWCFGDTYDQLGHYAWIDSNSKREPQPVGRKLPNAWGLHDMHGNVWEWCWDWYGRYSTESLRNPIGPSKGEYRSLRGGAFIFSSEIVRSADRFWATPSICFRDFGFRCVRGHRSQPRYLS